MRHSFILLSVMAFLIWGFPKIAAAQETFLPSATTPDNIAKGALMCPWLILLNVRDFQRRCHPVDQEFGNRLDEPINQLQTFFLRNKWADQDLIDKAHKSPETSDRYIEEHPLHTVEGVVSNICDSKDMERLYQRTRDTLDDVQRKLSEALVNPPLLQSPLGTPCL